MIRTFVGAVAATLAMLAGLWLMIAPFALGTQPEDADWTNATQSEFFSGLAVAVVGLAGAIAFALSIYEELVTRGLVVPKQRAAEPEPEPEPVPAAAPQASSADLAGLLAPLVEALREDLNTARHSGEHRQNGKAPLVGVEETR
ncbi:SPW repeat protein [Nonomuraea candida]|uniref:SPW repeat protein n=1 Tax=Nonomuraea candida TaxID=359159 RepID=UPI0012FB8DB9|nr:SPW repeat protein [Nonomuraea candida]